MKMRCQCIVCNKEIGDPPIEEKNNFITVGDIVDTNTDHDRILGHGFKDGVVIHADKYSDVVIVHLESSQHQAINIDWLTKTGKRFNHSKENSQCD